MFRVQHSKAAMEFFIKFDTGSKAALQYNELPGNVLDFHHTTTPPDQQGKGIAKLLVKEGFKYAAAEHKRVQPTCWYVEKYVNEMANEEEKKIATTYKSNM